MKKEADELIILDYAASKEKRGIDYKKITEIAGEAFMPMSYGGGITSLEEAKRIFDAGYEKIILNSVLFKDLSIIDKIAAVYGSQAVVGSVDVKKNLLGKYKVFSHSASNNTGYDPLEWAKKLEENGVGEIMVNAVDRDGTWNGYDEILIEKIAKAVKVPLVACGGAGKFEDFSKAVQSGASAVAAGSMFIYQKKGMGVLISFPSVIFEK